MKSFLLSTLFLMFTQLVFSQDFGAISDALEQGNASQISQLFDNSIEFAEGDELEVMERTDAEKRLRGFFLSNQPEKFEIIHKGKSDKGIHYMIGNLITSTHSYRMTIYMAEKMDEFYIRSLEIDKTE